MADQVTPTSSPVADQGPLEEESTSMSRFQSHSTYSLIFFTAQWCDPAIPMAVIFEETIRDLKRLHPELRIEGVIVDLDEEETNQQLRAAPATVSVGLLESIDFVPIIVLLEGNALEGTELTRLVGQLPKLVIRHQLLAALGLD